MRMEFIARAATAMIEAVAHRHGGVVPILIPHRDENGSCRAQPRREQPVVVYRFERRRDRAAPPPLPRGRSAAGGYGSGDRIGDPERGVG